MDKAHSKLIIPLSYYHNEDVVTLSKTLLGKILVTKINNCITSGMIVETEAYNGVLDKASHAYNHRRTQRTETMYAKGGVAYIYLCYGIHHLFNIVTAGENNPQAVLIRAIEPIDGIPHMLLRRNLKQQSARLTAGPGILTSALGITTALDGSQLDKPPIWLEDRNIKVSKGDIVASPRIGIDYAEEHKELPWRFYLRKSKCVSIISK
ncbi:MAG: DNA-3-methyladenine glycosylase [Proteobacteria bacterium]|nr:DNA-3-methyladenine glycosylase [Pseudomonadota bacterium]